jgi:hypothetical protein
MDGISSAIGGVSWHKCNVLCKLVVYNFDSTVAERSEGGLAWVAPGLSYLSSPWVPMYPRVSRMPT